MRHKFLVFTFALITLGVGAAVFYSPVNSLAATTNKLANPRPTPKPRKPASVKGVVAPVFHDTEFDGSEVIKTNAEWKKLLTPAAYYVMREEGTEAPYSGALLKNHRHGTYYCAACHLALFRSTAKFESDTGWPSFFQPIFKKNLVEKIDKSLGEERTEVECPRCHAHLGHVFDDGPQPTGLRYCINSVALTFKASR